MDYVRRFSVRVSAALVAGMAAVLAMSGCVSSHTLRDFTTDGCSFFPEGDAQAPGLWSNCCVSHDVAYWQGGTADERRSADSQLRDCVLARTGRPDLANRMYRGVRLSGAPLLPTTFRWGYGWGYGRGYEALTPEERRQAEEQLAAHRRTHPDDALTTSTATPAQTTP